MIVGVVNEWGRQIALPKPQALLYLKGTRGGALTNLPS